MKTLYVLSALIIFTACASNTTGPNTATNFYGLSIDTPVMELPLDVETSGVSQDISGEGNSATLVDGADLVFGRQGHALRCDDDDEHAIVAESDELDIQDEITISLWIKSDEDRISWDGVRQREIIFRKGGNMMLGFEQEDEDDVCLRLYTRFSISPDKSQSSEIHLKNEAHPNGCEILDNKWHHIVASFKKSGSYKLIVDGNLSGECNDTEAVREENLGYGIKLSSVNNDYIVGARKKSDGTVDRELRSIIDHVYIYDKQLSDADALKLYNGDSL